MNQPTVNQPVPNYDMFLQPQSILHRLPTELRVMIWDQARSERIRYDYGVGIGPDGQESGREYLRNHFGNPTSLENLLLTCRLMYYESQRFSNPATLFVNARHLNAALHCLAIHPMTYPFPIDQFEITLDGTSLHDSNDIDVNDAQTSIALTILELKRQYASARFGEITRLWTTTDMDETQPLRVDWSIGYTVDVRDLRAATLGGSIEEPVEHDDDDIAEEREELEQEGGLSVAVLHRILNVMEDTPPGRGLYGDEVRRNL